MKSKKWTATALQIVGGGTIITGMIILFPFSVWLVIMGFGALGVGLLIEPEPVDGEKIDAS